MNYYRYQTRPLMGPAFFNSMVARIIAVNLAVFLIQTLVPAFTMMFALTPRLVVEKLYVWQLVTYMFLHGGFAHIFFNMLMLWLFGTAIESVWGGRNFLRYYIFCGIGGALASMIFTYNAIVVGASAAIFGLYLAYAMMFPDNRIYLYFLFPVKAKYLVMGLAVFQLLQGLAGPAGIAYFAHLGGMAAGLLFFRSDLLRRVRFGMGPRRRWRQYTADRDRENADAEHDNIDSILDKISAKGGYDHLTTTEKRILENYRRKLENDKD